jgi:hypothetical protein
MKVARTVTTGGMGKHSLAVRPVPTHSDPPNAAGIASYSGHEIKLAGDTGVSEAEPYCQEAHVTDAARVRLYVEPETP